MHKTVALPMLFLQAGAALLLQATPAVYAAARDTEAWVMDSSTCPAPVYPPDAARNEQTGEVVLAMLIDTKGNVTDAVVRRSSGHLVLDEAAQALLSRCRFQLRNGAGGTAAPRPAVPVWQHVAYVWSLNDASTPAALPVEFDLTSCARPSAPPGALRKGQTTRVGLTYLLLGNGTRVSGKVTASSGNAALDQATLDGLAPCRFMPVAKAVAGDTVWIQTDYIWPAAD